MKNKTVVKLIEKAGGKLAQTVENYTEYIKLTQDNDALHEDYFALKMVGDSMNLANIPEGSTAVVDRQLKVKDGEIGAVVVNGEVSIKRIYNKHTHIVLASMSSNPVYQPQVYFPADQVQVLGKVNFVVVNVG